MRRNLLGALGAGVLGLGLPAAALAPHTLQAATTRSAVASPGVPQVGALYANGSTGHHRCTASVVDSPGGNTLITAAHCVSGTGSGMVFAPAQDGRKTPDGRWTITAAHVAPSWISRQDQDADFAFLTVAPRRINGRLTNIQTVTGGYRLGATAASGERVTVLGYPAGSDDEAITCRATVRLTSGYPTFDCAGYVGGTSGAPWLRATGSGLEIAGVIGGLHQGGCVASTSYASPLGRPARVAFSRAEDGAPSDDLPSAGSDGCG